MSEKRKFSETGFGQFLNKAGKVLPNILDVGANLATGNISGAIGSVSDALKAKAATDAEAAKLLVELEQSRQNWMLELERVAVELERVHADDRNSARKRETTMAATGKRDITPTLLALVAVVAFGFSLYVVAFRNIPEANREMFIHILGIIEGGMITLVFQYYFGSSAGSRQKTQLLKGDR